MLDPQLFQGIWETCMRQSSSRLAEAMLANAAYFPGSLPKGVYLIAARKLSHLERFYSVVRTESENISVTGYVEREY